MMGDERVLSSVEVDAIADKVVEKIREKKSDFWIDPEEHYLDHTMISDLDNEEISSLKELSKAYRTARSLFWKAFFGFAMVGFVMFAVIGVLLGVKR